MIIDRDEAARALTEAKAAAARSTTAAGYQRVSGNLFVWGAVWIVANVAGFFRMPYGGVAFPALLLIGVAGSLAVGFSGARGSARRDNGARALLVAAAVALFCTGVQVVAPTNSLIVAEALICLAIGASYMVLAGALGWRLAAVGAAQMVGTIVGWVYAREQFFLWMAVVGGGGLILGGFWLRKA